MAQPAPVQRSQIDRPRCTWLLPSHTMSTQASSTLTTPNGTKANAPFDGELFFDVVFITSDDVHFHLAKAILLYASPFFADMFSLIRPAETERSTEDPQRVPISEDSKTFETLMRYCYPVVDPDISSLEDLDKVLEAARKYQVTVATETLRKLLRGYTTSLDAALHVYATACRFDCEAEAAHAAEYLKNADCGDDNSTTFHDTIAGRIYSSEMSTVTAGAYYRLILYLRPGGRKPTSFIRFRPQATESFRRLARRSNARTSDNDSGPVAPSTSDVAADVALRSVDGTTIPAHSTVLRLAGAGKLLEGGREDGDGGIPVYPVDLPGATMLDLIHACYPFGYHDFGGLRYTRLASLIAAASRYDIAKIITAARRQLADLVKQDPLKVWFLACEHGWEEEMKAAARAVASRAVSHHYVVELETAPASAYHRLLRFCHRYKHEVNDMMAEQLSKPERNWCQSPDAGTLISTPVLELALCAAKNLANSSYTCCLSCQTRILGATHYHSGACPRKEILQPITAELRVEAIMAVAPHWEELYQQKVSEVSITRVLTRRYLS